MPRCVRCGYVGASATFRRIRKDAKQNAGEYKCMDKHACKRRRKER